MGAFDPDLVDDGADYSQRIEALQSGEIQLAAFTIDALITASAELGELPATIVALIDETRRQERHRRGLYVESV